jgi:hypothetical protein
MLKNLGYGGYEMTERDDTKIDENQAKNAAPEAQEADAPLSEDGAAPASGGENSPSDSATFMRCAGCRHAKEVDVSAGTLACGKHNMLINAEADEIPDDCPEHEPAG